MAYGRAGTIRNVIRFRAQDEASDREWLKREQAREPLVWAVEHRASLVDLMLDKFPGMERSEAEATVDRIIAKEAAK